MDFKSLDISKSKLITLGTGLLVGLLGLIVSFGWIFNVPVLTNLSPIFAPMQFNTALCFFLCGVALITIGLKKFLISRIALALILLISILTVLEYLTGLSFGIDNFFVSASESQVKTLFAGRMSPPTTLSFLMIGIGILLSNFKSLPNRIPVAVSLIASVVFALALSTVLGYILKFEPADERFQLLGMALHTSIGFLLASLGVFSFSVTQENVRKKVAPRWIAAPVAVVVMSVAVIMWQTLLTHEFRNLKTYIQLQSLSIKHILDEKLTLQFNALQRMANRLETVKSMSHIEWQKDAQLFLRHFDSYYSVAHVDSKLTIVGSVVDNTLNDPFALPTVAELRLLRAKSKKDSQFVYSRAIENNNSPVLFLIVPIYHNDQFNGFVEASLDARNFLDFGYGIEPDIKYSISFHSDGNDFELFGACCPDINSALMSKFEFTDARGSWQIYTWPTDKLIAEHGTYLPQVVLLGGVLLSLLSFLMIQFGITAQYRTREMVELNESLEEKIDERTRELKESDEFMRHWLSRCTDGAWDWDLEKNTVYMTPQFKALLGFKEDEIDDSVDNWRRLVPPMDLQTADKAYHDYINQDKRYAYQIRWTHKNGSMVWTLCRGEGIRNNHGKIVRMVGTLTDISQLKRLEEELTHWAEQLQRKNSDLEKFNRSVVGREKRMIELKSKINALCKELGRAEPYKLTFLNEQAESIPNDRR